MSIVHGYYVPVQPASCRYLGANSTSMMALNEIYNPGYLTNTSLNGGQRCLTSDDTLRWIQPGQIRSREIPWSDHPYLHHKEAYYSGLTLKHAKTNVVDHVSHLRPSELHITCSQTIEPTPRFVHQANRSCVDDTMPIASTNYVSDADTFCLSDLQDFNSVLDNDDLSYDFIRDFLHADDETCTSTRPLVDLDPVTLTENQFPDFNTLETSTCFQPHQVEDISATCFQPATTMQHAANSYHDRSNSYLHESDSYHHESDLYHGQPDTPNANHQPNWYHESSSNSNDTNTSLINSVYESSMSQWASKYPRLWSTDDVLDWLYSSVEKEGVDFGRLRGEAFQNINGVQLCNMTQQEFVDKEPEYGGLLFTSFKKLTNSATRVPSSIAPTSEFQQNEKDPSSTTNSILLGTTGLTVINATFNGGWIGSIPNIQNLQQSQPPSETLTNSIVISTTNATSLPLPASGPYCYPRPLTSTFKPKRRPGRPRIRKRLTDAEIEQEKQKKRLKNQHLWEFLYDALKNPGYNPCLMKWEDEMEGVFRFVQSERMAHVWGDLKNNGNMNYEKLSRAMRHYYRRGILERVEGKRLVYKFSKTAIDKLKSRPNKT